MNAWHQDQLPQSLCENADQSFENLVPSAYITDQIVQFLRDRSIVAAKRN